MLFFSLLTGNVSVVAGVGSPSALASSNATTVPTLRSPRGIAWSSHMGLFIADYAANRLLLVDPNLTVVTVFAGSGAAASSDGPALAAGLKQPVGLLFNPAGGGLYITDSWGLRQLTLAGFIPDPPARYVAPFLNITDALRAGQTAITTAIATTVAMAVSTSVAASAAGAMGGSMGGALAAAQAGSVGASVGGAALTLVTSVQFFSLTSGASVNMSDTYRALGCSLAWSNFQFGILGQGSQGRPQCRPAPTASSSTNATGANATASGRRSLLAALTTLLSSSQQGGGRLLLADGPSAGGALAGAVGISQPDSVSELQVSICIRYVALS